MGSFSIALSGLDADSTALNTIGNNLANLNTTAYKGQITSFEDLFYQQIGRSGSGDAIQVGAGTKVSGTTTDFSEGTILPDADIERVAASVQEQDQGQGDGGLAGGDRQREKHEDLALQITPEMCEGNKVDGYPLEHQLRRQKHQDHVAPAEKTNDPQHE